MGAKRAVLFDLGGVLIEWDPRYVYRPLFADEEKMEWFLEDVCDAEWNRSIDAGRPFLEAVQARQAERPDYAELIGLWYSRWAEMLRGDFPDSVMILAELQAQDTRLYALTNWYKETFPIAKQRFGFLDWFEDIVVSGVEGLAKPDPAFFRLAMDRCGLVPEETLFVDDVRANVDSALSLGFDAICFTGADPLRRALEERGYLQAR